MAGNGYRAVSIFGFLACVVASCTNTPVPQQQPDTMPTSIYAGLGEEGLANAMAAIQKALESLPSDQPLTWDGANGLVGVITPLRTFKIKTGHFCRDFTESVIQDSNPKTMASRACRTNDGRWLRVPVDQP